MGSHVGQLLLHQLEVAQRLAAEPATRAYGLLSVWVQARYEVALVTNVSATCFWPRPEVTSAIVKMVGRRDIAGAGPGARVYDLTSYAFSHRRKQLAPLLAGAPARLRIAADDVRTRLTELQLDPKSRPENLTADQWRDLSVGEGKN